MAVQDIAYFELYTRDKVKTVDYFVSAMGFTRVADCVEVDRSSVLLSQGGVRLLVTSGRGIWRFLEKHGDGIADIAMTCDDVAATRRAALAAGAEPVGTLREYPVVSGFGDVSHTLLPANGGLVDGLPVCRRWTPTRMEPAAEAGRITALGHVAVCVNAGTLAQYADFYRDAFGFSRHAGECVALGGQAMEAVVVRSASERVDITLAAPDPGRDPGRLDAFLERNGGPGVQHLAFLVEDIVPAVREFRGRGIEELRDAHLPADRDEWGPLPQLFSRSPHEADTLFFELIQRRGSRAFGSADIGALYEAVERDRLASR
ncbi:4-hydroxyphenylpyruvate dioxygenase [Kitasatospora nipponensis]|uniref:4-hydroxyphenylpyruvate dioxygenase n=1 Tax=Kitasatospora nipponensis TaxID=258049 RepID=A0ABP4GXS5_9ACTN